MKHKKIIIILTAFLINILLTVSYTPDSYSNQEHILSDGYTAPNYDSIDIVLGEVADSCTCPGSGNNHIFDLSDNCVVSTCTADTISFIDSGNPVGCTGLWHIQEINTSLSEWLINITSSCNINMTS